MCAYPRNLRPAGWYCSPKSFVSWDRSQRNRRSVEPLRPFAVFIVLAACGPLEHAAEPRASARPADTPFEAPTPVSAPVRADCDPEPTPKKLVTTPETPASSFRRAQQVLHLRVVESVPGEPFESARCVALELEIVDVFRGNAGKRGDRLRLVVQQSMVTSWRSRPASRWWVIEHELQPGSELVAVCPTHDPLTAQLRGSCDLHDASTVADLQLVRTAEEIFTEAPHERTSARAALDAYRGEHDTTQLRAWLDAK